MNRYDRLQTDPPDQRTPEGTEGFMKPKWRVFWIIASLLVMAIIFFFSSQASGKSEDLSDAFAGVLKLEQTDKKTRVSNQTLFLGLTLRKLAHIVLYAALSFCLCNAFTGVRGKIFWSAGIGYAYAVLDEIHQTFSKRQGRWQDTVIDLIGIAIGIIAVLLFRMIWKEAAKRKKKKAIT